MGVVHSVDATPGSKDFRAGLLAAPMSRFQQAAIAIILVLCALDGFDVFAITFAAPSIEREMAIGRGALGLVFAAGLVGMAFGSLLLAPAADIYGRKKLVIASLLLMIAGTLWTAAAHDITQLAMSRILTGLGIGAMIAVINPLAAEYANARRRDLTVTLLNLGFPFGGFAGGLLSAQLMPAFGWRSIFVAAALLAIVLLIVVVRWLPEPVAGILARPDASTLDRLNVYLRKSGQPTLAELPTSEQKIRGRSFSVVLSREELGNTARITSIYFLFVLSVFYIQSWIPTLVVSAGHTPSEAALVSTWMSLSGICGGLALGLLAPRVGLKLVVVFAFVLTALAILLFGWVTPTLSALTMIAVLVGVATIGGMANLYAVVSRSFPATARASGSGFVIGIGRFGSALGPALAGAMYAGNYGRIEVAAALAAPAIIAAVVLMRSRLHNFA